MESNHDYSKELSLSIPFESTASALLAFEVLAIDKELKSHLIRRLIHADGNNVHVSFFSSDLKLLRVAVNSFMKNVILVLKTMKQFGQC